MRANPLPALIAGLLLACAPVALATVGHAQAAASGSREAQSERPARYRAGGLPSQDPNAVGWEQATVDLHVDASGRVTAVRIVEATPGFEGRVTTALSGWSFRPAVHDDQPVAADVLVALVYRPPVLYNFPTAGNPPQAVESPVDTAPYPTGTQTPMYPVKATGDQIVLVQAEVGPDGTVGRTAVLSSASGFDQAARDAVEQWTFRPAHVDGEATAAYAYVAFGFRQPVTTKPPRPSSMSVIEKSSPSQRSTAGQ